MAGILVFFIIVIAYSVWFIFKTYHWLLSQPRMSRATIKIVERLYRVENFQSTFDYIQEKDFKWSYLPPSGAAILDTPDDVKYMIDDSVKEIAKAMLDSGCIEVKDRMDTHNPYLRRVILRAKVYKPES